MKFDILTILAAGASIHFAMSATVLIFWLRDRSATWLAWWSVAYTFLTFGNVALILQRQFLNDAAIPAGACLVLVGSYLVLQAVRVFEGKKAMLWPYFASLPILLIALYLTPRSESLAARMIVTTIPMAVPLLMASYELWRGRKHYLPSRFLLCFTLLSVGVLFIMRVPLAPLAPYPFGAMPTDENWVAAFNIFLVLAAIFSSVLMISLTLERSEHSVRTLAQSDPLTGLLNRRALDAAFADNEVPADTAVIVFDIDRFKLVNDVHGHAAGDMLLRRFADVCRENIRQVDLAARLGGEEFAIILPNSSRAVAMMVAERIRTAFAEVIVKSSAGPVSCTVSGGLEISPQHAPRILPELMANADRELYRAKRGGRNRVCMAQQIAA